MKTHIFNVIIINNLSLIFVININQTHHYFEVSSLVLLASTTNFRTNFNTKLIYTDK